MIFLALALGAVITAQVAMNRRLGDLWGLPTVTALHGITFIVAAFAYFYVGRMIEGGKLFQDIDFGHFRWWWVIPGMLGVPIIAVSPFLVAHIGALQAFVFMVAGQLISAVVWDYVSGQAGLSPSRIAGTLLAVAAGYLVSREG